LAEVEKARWIFIKKIFTLKVNYSCLTLCSSACGKAQFGETRGFMEAIVDADTNQILVRDPW